MFIVFTNPNKLTKTYQEAIEIADAHYHLTGEVVAVERSEITDNSINYRPLFTSLINIFYYENF